MTTEQEIKNAELSSTTPGTEGHVTVDDISHTVIDLMEALRASLKANKERNRGTDDHC